MKLELERLSKCLQILEQIKMVEDKGYDISIIKMDISLEELKAMAKIIVDQHKNITDLRLLLVEKGISYVETEDKG